MRKENVKVKSSQKNIIKIIRGIVIIMFLGITIYEQNHVQASEDKSLIQQQLEYYTRNIDVNNISKEDVLKVYDDISEEYTNEEVADLIKENSEEIKKQGISEEVIETGANFIRTTDLESLRDIIKNDIDVEDIIVIYDDLDLPHGKIRMRLKGSAGGHNGIKSLIAHLKTQEFKRIRIGIDRHPKIPVVDYVLGKFTEDELALVNQAIDLSVKACEMTLTESFNKVMTEYSK